MIRRWPIRWRLTAAFTLTMAVVLAGAGAGTVANTRASLDESIAQTLQYQLRDVQSAAETTTPALPNARDSAAQVLAGGRIVAGSREAAGHVLLSPSELAAAQRGPLLTEHPTAGSLRGPVRIAAAPAAGDSRIAVAAVSLADRDAAVADLARELAVFLPMVLVVAAVGAYLLATASLRPVERMRARAATITAEDPEQRLPLPASRDEVSRLGTTLNDMLDRLREALDRERRFVADASHEMRTPLSLLTTELELALQRPRTTDELEAALRSALEETERLSRLARDLLLLARADQTGPVQRSTVELHQLLGSIVDRYRNATGGHGITLECDSGAAVLTNRNDLDRAVSNLLDNALQHGAPPITVRATGTTDNAVTIEVRDHGPGIDPAFLPRAFDRFTQADNARTTGGTGLGLAIAAALARRNGGRATAANSDEGGARFILALPAAAPATPHRG